MPIPKEILDVEHPKSTRLKFQNGHYSVSKRTSKYIVTEHGKKDMYLLN